MTIPVDAFGGRTWPRVEGARRIAVLRANALGDLLVAWPALDALRNAYPDAELVLLAREWHREFLDARPGPIDRVVVLPPIRGVSVPDDAQAPDDPPPGFLAAMRREGFDLALQLHGERMLGVIRREGCGFVGCAAAGLAYLDDVRPDQQCIEPWEGPVVAEPLTPATIPWHRHVVNSAANPLHLERRLVRDGEVVRYKVAWVGGANVLFDRAKLREVGGFSFWRELPPDHAGEEVLVELLLLHAYGGCGILPSGTYHLCLPTNVPDRRHSALELLPRRLADMTA
jgi:hypothetical protein